VKSGDALKPALVSAARDLQQRSGPIRERELEEALVAAYSAAGGPGSIVRQAPLSLRGFRGVGNCDVAVVPGEGQRPILIELKWGAGTLCNCAWDAVKLALALHERKAGAAYLVAGAPLADWNAKRRGADLFGSREWSTRDFMTFYAKEFAFWRRDVKTRPELLPEHFSTTEGVQLDMQVAGTPWSLRSAQISSSGGLVAIGENGAVAPLRWALSLPL
jgi:hypothetical protein